MVRKIKATVQRSQCKGHFWSHKGQGHGTNRAKSNGYMSVMQLKRINKMPARS